MFKLEGKKIKPILHTTTISLISQYKQAHTSYTKFEESNMYLIAYV